MKALLQLCFLFFFVPIHSQVIFVSESNGELHRVDFQNCTSTLVCNLGILYSTFDLSFHPNGKLYIISDKGILREVDTINCTTYFIHDFLNGNNGQIFNSLVTDANGLFYTTGSDGDLFTYDLLTNHENYLGNIGYSAAGDLTFSNGNLYMAAFNNQLVQINLNNPPGSYVVMNINVANDVYGIFSYAESCSDIKPYLVAGNEIYKIDFNNKSIQFICTLPFLAYGGASTFEFYGSNPINIDSVQQQNPTCNQNNGSITIQARGGIGTLNYSIDGINYIVSNQFSGLYPGNYKIYIKDLNGCFISDSVFLLSSSNLNITILSMTNATCNQNNGTLNISGTGGSGILKYSLDGKNFQPTGNFDNLMAGTHTLVILDENGCTVSQSVDIKQNGTPVFTNLMQTNATCDQNNGSINTLGSGGKGSLSYSLDGANFQSSGIFKSLASRTYTLIVKDESGCTATQNLIIQQTGVPSINKLNQTDASCNQNNGSIMIEGIGGNGILKYSLDGINFQSSGIFNNLNSNNYNLVIQDESGCQTLQKIIIVQSGLPSIASADLINPKCSQNNGKISVNAFGGKGQLLYSIDGINFQAINVFQNLASGTYKLIIEDSLKCSFFQEFVLVDEDKIQILEVAVNPEICGSSNGKIVLFTKGGKGNLQYKLNNQVSQFENSFIGLAMGKYAIRIFDNQGCIVDTFALLNRICDVFLPNTFSPNGDGINDYFRAYTFTGTNSTVLSFTIFDRWGNLVFSKMNFTTDEKDQYWWDGTFNGQKLISGVYVYAIEMRTAENKIVKLKGDVTLLK